MTTILSILFWGYILFAGVWPFLVWVFTPREPGFSDEDCEDFPMFIGAYNPVEHEIEEWRKQL